MPDTRATTVVRLHADVFGESRFESLTIPMAQKVFAPPAAPLHVTQAQPAEHYVIIELPVGWVGQSRTRRRGGICCSAWLENFA
jgi:hypothetical protein